MRRLFVAIDLPDTVKKSIKELCTGLSGAKWVDTRQLHLTLKFIGEVDEGLFNSIKESLSEISENQFSLTLRGMGCFPPRRPPRVLWIGIDGNEVLERLAGKIERNLVEIDGIKPESRSFSPHITIARFREPPGDKVADYLSRNSSFRSETFHVKSFHLYSSELTPSGALHTREASYPLDVQQESNPL